MAIEDDLNQLVQAWTIPEADEIDLWPALQAKIAATEQQSELGAILSELKALRREVIELRVTVNELKTELRRPQSTLLLPYTRKDEFLPLG
jgi:predicted  nucleic acid-binding Zn-ribbon protein